MLYYIGLGTPLNRALFGGMLGFGTQLFFKPSISYVASSSGKYIAKPFYFSDKENGTFVPWWSWPIVSSLLFSLFV